MSPKKVVLFGAAWAFLILSVLAARADETSLAALIGKLMSSDQAARLQAIDQLGQRGAKAAEAVGPLTELLKDDSAKVRAHAARSLGEIGPPAKPAVAALVELVKDPDETVRQQAVQAVIHIRPGPQVTVPLCVKLLEDSDPGVRARILHAIAEAGPKALPGLIEALKNDQSAYWACLALRTIGPTAKDAVPALIEKLSDSHPGVRREAILALAAIGDAAAPAVGPIAAALKDEHTAVAATYALGCIGHIPADAEAAIQANAKSDDRMLSTTSLWALTHVHPDDKSLRHKTTELLIERLKDKDPFVRVAAARALAALPPDPEITAPLWEKAMQDADETTVLHALDALAALGPTAVPRLIDALKIEKTRGQVAYVLGRIGPAAAPATSALTKLLADKDDRVVHEAILALANIGPGAKDSVPTLIQLLEQGVNSGSPAIVYALGKIGPNAAAAEPVLSELLENPDRRLALASAWALAHIRPASAVIAAKTVPVLIAGLSGDTALARRGAAEGLGSLGPLAKESLSALRRALGDKDKAVRDAAERAIASIRGAQ